MLGERRSHPRFTINRTARYLTENGALPRECMITDISEEGARLFVSEGAIPDQFYLLISGDKSMREECLVAWRLGGEVGVRFVTERREKQRQEFMRRLRAETQRQSRSAASTSQPKR